MLVQRKGSQKKHGPGRDPSGCARRFPALLACQGDGAQLASLRHVRLFAPCPAAVLGSLYGRGKSNAKGNGKINSDSNRKGKSKSKSKSCEPPARDRPQT